MSGLRSTFVNAMTSDFRKARDAQEDEFCEHIDRLIARQAKYGIVPKKTSLAARLTSLFKKHC